MLKELIVKEDPKSPISEIFRTLRTNIQFTNTKNKMKSLLVTSTLAGEGKSWISANLAVTFAQMGKKVIVLDADMRKGRQYRIFNVSPRPGLSNYLSGITDDGKEVDLADYVQETEVDNLYLIPAGDYPPNPSELLVSENMTILLNKLKDVCDIVIIDGPPTQLITDSLILTRICDSTVIVAESNKTKKESLRRIIDNIQKVGGKIAGVILNKVPLSAKKYEQSYYYGSTNMNKKEKRNKKETTQNKSEDGWERKNKNTERARQLINQKKENEENIKENDNNVKTGNIKKFEFTNIEKNKQNDDINLFNYDLSTDKTENLFGEKTNVEQNLNAKPNTNDVQNLNDATSIYFKQNINIEQNAYDGQNTNAEQTFNTVQNSFETAEFQGTNGVHLLDEKTQDIFRQVNEYIENERKNSNQ